MQCTERKTARTRLLPFAAVALTAGALLLVPVAEAQMNPPQARPQAQSPQTPSLQTPSPSAPISDEKLNAAAAVLGQVATIRQSYESKIAAAPPSDKQRLPKERNDAFKKADTDQVFLWMNSIALSVPPKTTPRSTQSSFNVFRIPAIRGV
jgi:hypothetical protein